MTTWDFVAQATNAAGPGLPTWWPIAAVLITVFFSVVVALIQYMGNVRVAKIQIAAKPVPAKDEIVEQVLTVLGGELDKRLGPQRVAEAQSAFNQGRTDAQDSVKNVLEAHQRKISELQAQLAAREPEIATAKPEVLAAAMLYNAGMDAHQQGHLAEAIGMYSAAIKLDPGYARAYYNRGNAKYDLGDKPGALEDYNQCSKLDPTDAKAWYNFGNTKFDLGDMNSAVLDYSESIRLDPTFAFAFHNRGNAKSALGNSEGAIADFDLALALDPKFARAYYNKSCELAKLGDADEAVKTLQKAIELDPKWVDTARTDADFDLLREQPPFRALLS